MHKINHDGMKIIGQANETEIAAAEQLVNDCIYREHRYQCGDCGAWHTTSKAQKSQGEVNG